MIRVGVAGATGYAGAELVRILAGHPHAQIELLTSRQYAGVPFSQAYPALKGFVDLPCEDLAPEAMAERVDVVFLALPHKLPMALVPALMDHGVNVIDLSADFRFQNVATYEAAYQPHTAKDLIAQAVYGHCEIYFERIRNARLIGNPGCYPTSTILPLAPLLKAGMVAPTDIIVDAKSGVSGAGRSVSLTTHFCEVNESYKAYKVAQHRHNPEMEEILSLQAATRVDLTFVPHLVPMTRGMLTTVYARLTRPLETGDLLACLADFYADRPFVRICAENSFPDTLDVRGTNFCDIGARVDRRNGRAILVSAIDNLVKGAAGQAVQNMNIMEGIDECTGLMQVPYPL